MGKARILDEALPFFQRFRGKTFVIKLGGAAMVDDAAKNGALRDITTLQTLGIRPVVVHGGGQEISAMMKNLGLKAKFIAGLRVTDKAVMKVADMVLGGSVNGDLVRRLNKLACLAVGLSGDDGGMFLCTPLRKNLGWVGKIKQVNDHLLRILQNNNVVPVIAPLGSDKQGRPYNINADTAAGALAGALGAAKLIILTDVPGVMAGKGAGQSLISHLTEREVRKLIKNKVIQKGMVPKVEACLKSLSQGTLKAHILDGRVPHALLLEIFTSQGIGSEIVP